MTMTTTTTIIGIDPGKSGGIAWIGDSGPVVEKMPETLADLWEVIAMLVYHDERHGTQMMAYLEEVQPGGLHRGKEGTMGAKSSFVFGRGVGQLEMALTAAGIPFERVRPQQWQKSLGCLTKGDKNVSKRKAQELFPTLKVTHATADALLIAEYGRRVSNRVMG
jgi:hypothetical protein